MKKKNDKTIRKRINCFRVKKSKKGVQKGGTIIGKRTLQKHQIRVGEKIKSFMNNREGSPNGILLFHGAGTGKTISSLWCVLNIFYDFDKKSIRREGILKRVILIGPTEALLTQFEEELEKLKSNQSDVETVMINMIIQEIKENLIYFSLKQLKDVTVEEGPKGKKLNKEFQSIDWKDLKSECVMIIDESHYLRKDFDNTLYNALLSNKSFKILLTATPFVSNISDIGFYNNIIKGEHSIPIEINQFMEEYGKRSGFRGLASYVIPMALLFTFIIQIGLILKPLQSSDLSDPSSLNINLNLPDIVPEEIKSYLKNEPNFSVPFEKESLIPSFFDESLKTINGMTGKGLNVIAHDVIQLSTKFDNLMENSFPISLTQTIKPWLAGFEIGSNDYITISSTESLFGLLAPLIIIATTKIAQAVFIGKYFQRSPQEVDIKKLKLNFLDIYKRCPVSCMYPKEELKDVIVISDAFQAEINTALKSSYKWHTDQVINQQINANLSLGFAFQDSRAQYYPEQGRKLGFISKSMMKESAFNFEKYVLSKDDSIKVRGVGFMEREDSLIAEVDYILNGKVFSFEAQQIINIQNDDYEDKIKYKVINDNNERIERRRDFKGDMVPLKVSKETLISKWIPNFVVTSNSPKTPFYPTKMKKILEIIDNSESHDRILIYSSFKDVSRFISYCLNREGKRHLVYTKDTFEEAEKLFHRRCPQCKKINLFWNFDQNKVSSEYCTREGCNLQKLPKWEESRIMILDEEYVEGINIYGVTKFIITEPLDSPYKQEQLHARVLRYKDPEDEMKDIMGFNSGKCQLSTENQYFEELETCSSSGCQKDSYTHCENNSQNCCILKCTIYTLILKTDIMTSALTNIQNMWIKRMRLAPWSHDDPNNIIDDTPDTFVKKELERSQRNLEMIKKEVENFGVLGGSRKNLNRKKYYLHKRRHYKSLKKTNKNKKYSLA